MTTRKARITDAANQLSAAAAAGDTAMIARTLVDLADTDLAAAVAMGVEALAQVRGMTN